MPTPETTIARLRTTLDKLKGQDSAPTQARGITLRKLRDYASGSQLGERLEYWRGRRPKDDKLDDVRKLATMDDQLGPALQRIISGVLGRDPEWTLRREGSDVTSAILDQPQTDQEAGEGEQPTADQRRIALKLQELEQAGSTWHHDANLHDTLRTALHACLWGGRASLRVYIPQEYALEATQGGLSSLEAALELIHVQAVTALDGGPIEDEHGRIIGHYYRYTKTEGTQQTPMVEVHTPELIEHYKVTPAGLEPTGLSYPNPLFDPARRRRPHYLMHTLQRRDGPALTPSLLDMQDALNIELTNMRRNSDMGGFRAIVTLNADPPIIVDETTGEVTTAEWVMGPDVVLQLFGVPLAEADGLTGGDIPTGRANPGIQVIDPVNPDTFLRAAEAWRTMILQQLDQGHIIEKFRAVSGESKRESRDDFDKRLKSESGPVEDALAWVIPTVLRFAAWLTDGESEEELRDLACDPRLYLDVSRGNLDVFQALTSAYDQGLAGPLR